MNMCKRVLKRTRKIWLNKSIAKEKRKKMKCKKWSFKLKYPNFRMKGIF